MPLAKSLTLIWAGVSNWVQINAICQEVKCHLQDQVVKTMTSVWWTLSFCQNPLGLFLLEKKTLFKRLTWQRTQSIAMRNWGPQSKSPQGDESFPQLPKKAWRLVIPKQTLTWLQLWPNLWEMLTWGVPPGFLPPSNYNIADVVSSSQHIPKKGQCPVFGWILREELSVFVADEVYVHVWETLATQIILFILIT